MAKTPGGGSGPGKEDSMLNGHKEGDANPFAEYMWMENEEEYNRQVSETSKKNEAQGVFCGYRWIGLKISQTVKEYSVGMETALPVSRPCFEPFTLNSHRWRRSFGSRSFWSAVSRRC